MELPIVTQATFQAKVLQAPLPALVDFSAVWCGPCKMLDPIVKQLAEQWAGKILVFKMDVDQNPDLVLQYQVMSVPTLLLFSGGKIMQRLSGYQPKDKLISRLSPHIR